MADNENRIDFTLPSGRAVVLRRPGFQTLRKGRGLVSKVEDEQFDAIVDCVVGCTVTPRLTAEPISANGSLSVDDLPSADFMALWRRVQGLLEEEGEALRPILETAKNS